jgi:hypothetical protein
MSDVNEAREIICELANSDAPSFWTQDPSAIVTDDGDVFVVDEIGIREYLSDDRLIAFAEWLLIS